MNDNIKVYFTYINIWGESKIHEFDYGNLEENFDKSYFDADYNTAFKMMDSELNAMVDDCEELISWEIERY